MSTNTEKLLITAAVGAVLYYMLKPASSKAHVNSQQEQFYQDLRDIDKLPLSLWDPNHTPRPTDFNWRYNFDRS